MLDLVQLIRVHMLEYLTIVGPHTYFCKVCNRDCDLVDPTLVDITDWVCGDILNRVNVGYSLLGEDDKEKRAFFEG